MVLGDIVAGCFAGFGICAVGHPFDTLKVLLQTGRYSTLGDAFRATVATHGPAGLYKGVASPLVGMGVFNAVQFAVFAGLKRSFTDDGRNVTLNRIAAAAGVTGVVVALVEGPQDLFKCQMQSQLQTGAATPAASAASAAGKAAAPPAATAPPRYTGTLDCARTIIRERGLIAGPMQGIGATIARNIVGVTAYFYAYEAARLGMAGSTRRVDELGFLETMLAGGLGGVGYWALCYPLDIVKTAVQCDAIDPAHRRYKGALDAARQLWAEGGARRFSAGLTPALMRSFPANAAGFAIYEAVKKGVDGPAKAAGVA
jgi:solute carrier family 25 carnitine/acylcarnitine transporter 20/29